MDERTGQKPCLFVYRIRVSGERMKRVVALIRRGGEAWPGILLTEG